MLYYWPIYAVLLIYLCCTTDLFMLYYWSIYAVLLIYLCCTIDLFMLYYWSNSLQSLVNEYVLISFVENHAWTTWTTNLLSGYFRGMLLLPLSFLGVYRFKEPKYSFRLLLTILEPVHYVHQSSPSFAQYFCNTVPRNVPVLAVVKSSYFVSPLTL
jgi:hypothetical protein